MPKKHKNNSKKSQSPAILGGRPMFSRPVTITKPTISSISKLQSGYGRILRSGMITNARYVKEFEEKLSKYLGVKNAVAVSSCTSGLMLVMKILKLKGEVIVPSFTFHATVHAIVWSGLKPVFVDCDPKTFNVDPDEVNKAITSKTSAILGVHVFGNPCPIKELEKIAKKRRIPLIFDSAHGFGAKYQGHRLGRFGKAEVFSVSPTKLLTAGEGGIVATNDTSLANAIRVGRNYGDPGTYECEFSGVNARMSEFHALLGISSLKDLDKNARKRKKLVALYKKRLKDIPGVRFQHIADKSISSFKDFSILIDKAQFGLNRDVLCACLEKENISTRKYFYPPVHTQRAFKKYYQKKYINHLKNTWDISKNVLSLPLYSDMPQGSVEKVCLAIRQIYENCEKKSIMAAVRRQGK